MLLLTASEQRMNDLQELIGKPIQFVQHRRQDIDFIYLVAQPAPARQIVPSLAYLYAAEIQFMRVRTCIPDSHGP